MEDLTECLNNARSNISNSYELDAEILENIHKIIVDSCKPMFEKLASKSVISNTPAKAAKVARPKSAYNMYVKDQFRLNKESNSGSNSQELMSVVSGQWATLSTEKKAIYIKMAEEANANFVPEPQEKTKSKELKVKRKRRITGYNIFYRENKDSIKANRDPNIKTMQAVGAAWKSLSEDERIEYNSRAEAEDN